MESLSFDNFQRRAQKPIAIWQQEQTHYSQQYQQRERSLRRISLVFIILIGIIGTIAFAFVPDTILVAASVIGIVAMLGATTWRIHRNEVASWENRANRLFAPELRANIIKAYFPSLIPYDIEQSPHKLLYKSQLYNSIESLKLEHQWEGFVGDYPVRWVISRIGALVDTHDIFIQIKMPVDTPIAYFWQARNLGDIHPSQKPLVEFGYFDKLETEFHFFCDARGYMAAFIEKNLYLLQQIAKLQIPKLQIMWHRDDVFCRFDAAALKDLLGVEFSQTNVSNQLEMWYKSLLRIEELIGLLAQLTPVDESQQ